MDNVLLYIYIILLNSYPTPLCVVHCPRFLPRIQLYINNKIQSPNAHYECSELVNYCTALFQSHLYIFLPNIFKVQMLIQSFILLYKL